MAASPRIKLINPRGEYVAAFKHAEDCAAVIANYGDGCKVQDGRDRARLLWHEGHEEFSASASYDAFARVIYTRMRV